MRELIIKNHSMIQYKDAFDLIEGDYFIYEDIFGRRFKLEPVTNENIKFPFIITPLGDEK